jgi:hypothetical protein
MSSSSETSRSKKFLFTILILLLINLKLPGQSADTTFYLITCGPGTETYSIYGHSALRVVINKSDTVYNWGVFDFSVSNFAWKFAKGRLNYMLIMERTEQFLPGYFYDKRWVVSQKINLGGNEKKVLLSLIEENLKPENVRYRYDFFYDDCSTRIRDLLEKSIGDKLSFPAENSVDLPTFRQLVSHCQKPYPWLQLGVDMIMGSPGEIKAGFRDRMFLPDYLKDGLSAGIVNRSGNNVPLLQNADVLLDFESPVIHQYFYLSPLFIFSALLLFVLLFTVFMKAKMPNDLLDMLLYAVFSILAIMMIFFNHFTDHQQMRGNYNIIWLNPFIIFCLFCVIFNKPWKIWFRIVFFISAAFLAGNFFLPQSFNAAIYPLVLIILIRSAARAGFSWNPLSV